MTETKQEQVITNNVDFMLNNNSEYLNKAHAALSVSIGNHIDALSQIFFLEIKDEKNQVIGSRVNNQLELEAYLKAVKTMQAIKFDISSLVKNHFKKLEQDLKKLQEKKNNI